MLIAITLHKRFLLELLEKKNVFEHIHQITAYPFIVARAGVQLKVF